MEQFGNVGLNVVNTDCLCDNNCNPGQCTEISEHEKDYLICCKI